MNLTLTIVLVLGIQDSLNIPQQVVVARKGIEMLEQIPGVDIKHLKFIKIRNRPSYKSGYGKMFLWEEWLRRSKNRKLNSDLVHVLDGPDSYGFSQGGLAWVCQSWVKNKRISWSSVVLSKKRVSNIYLDAAMVAHEIAHNLGARHTPVSDTYSFMNTFMLSIEPVPQSGFYWNEKSINEIGECQGR